MNFRPSKIPGSGEGPAFYAVGEHTIWRDIRAILHPPYTAWHLSYVVIGSLIGPKVNWTVLGAAVVAFFLAVGVAAHALDEVRGHPLGTYISSGFLVVIAAVALVGAVSLGVAGVYRLGLVFAVFVCTGTALVVTYNLELFGGLVHTDLGFAFAWGAFPVLTAAFAQQHSLKASALVLAVAAALLSAAQRSLSNPARLIRRHAGEIEGRMVLADGTVKILTRSTLLAPLEKTLRIMSWAIVILAVSLALVRLGF